MSNVYQGDDKKPGRVHQVVLRKDRAFVPSRTPTLENDNVTTRGRRSFLF